MFHRDYIENFPLNGGEMRDVRLASGDEYRVEVMGPGISKHEKPTIAMYFMNGPRKVEVTYDGQKFGIYHFKQLSYTKHYWSTSKAPHEMAMSRQYSRVAELLPKIYRVVFG